MRLIIGIFAARWLGHGRASECYLILVALLYGTLLLTPGAAFDSKATVDIAWQGYGHWLALPLLLNGVIGGSGLLANIRGWPLSRELRFAGALLGFVVWFWCVAKFVVIGEVATVGFPFCAIAALFDIRIMGLALARLPRSGAPGAV